MPEVSSPEASATVETPVKLEASVVSVSAPQESPSV